MSTSVEQITAERKEAGCVGCSTVVRHDQVAGFTGSGFKIYQWVPVAHRRADGSWCPYLADVREQLWELRKQGRKSK